MKKKIKILAQENNQVCLFEENTNASTLSEKKPPLINQIEFVVRIIMNMQAVSVGSFKEYVWKNKEREIKQGL